MAGLVKHYQSTMQGIPQLTNNWGSMIALLDAVLITGFNQVPVISVNKSTPTAITATIYLGSGHGFIDRQVVRIAGSTNGWDGDYKVLSADSASILVECLPEQPSVSSGTATCFTAPLDFEIVHQTPSSSLQPKRAYRSKDLESLGLILLVHDFCLSGAAAEGAKFAKVGIVSDMIDIDTIIGTQMPFDPANPGANWGWDGAYHGWAKWYYRTRDYQASNTTLPDTSITASGNSSFTIVGDSTSFCIDAYTSNQNSYVTYGVFEFEDESYQGKNLALLAFGLPTRLAETQTIINSGRTALVHQTQANIGYGSPTVNIRGMLWFNESGVEQAMETGEFLALSPSGMAANSYTTNSPILTDLVVLDVNGRGRGILPFLKATTLRATTEGVAGYGKYINRYGYSNAAMVIKHAVFLETH